MKFIENDKNCKLNSNDWLAFQEVFIRLFPNFLLCDFPVSLDFHDASAMQVRLLGIKELKCLFSFSLEHHLKYLNDSYTSSEHSHAFSFSFSIFNFFCMLKIWKIGSLTRFKLTIGFTVPIAISSRWCLKIHLRVVHICYRSHCVVVTFAKLSRFSPHCKVERVKKPRLEEILSRTFR